MILLRGVAVGLLLICHYILWTSTQTLTEFLQFTAILNSVGIFIEVPLGLITGRAIRNARDERIRKLKLKELYPKVEEDHGNDQSL